ncbi:MAG: O-antigen ligase family protein [Candidatus Hydrogenedentes bacterium]|nr:O-antigen ligase family protein [Candidatus Hydrogenedentota bacterium]
MTDIQTKADEFAADETSPQSTLDRARIAIVCGTLIATALTYSTRFSSFDHPKVGVLALGVALLGLFAVFARRNPSMRVGNLFWIVIALFSLIDIVSDLRAKPARNNPHGDEVFALMFRYLLPLFVALSFALFSREKNRKWVSHSIVIGSVCASLLAIGQYAGVLTFLFPDIPASSPVYSVFGNSGLLGGYTAIAIPLAFALYLRDSRARPWLLFTLCTLMCALLLSGARSAWVASAAGCAVVIWKRPDFRKISLVSIALCAVSVVCVLVAPQQTVTRMANLFRTADAGIGLRLWFWAGAGEMIKSNAISGVDAGNFQLESPRYLGDVLWAPGGEHFAHNTLLTEHPHNDFLLIFAETGLIGVLFCLWLLTKIARGRGDEWGGLTAWMVFALFNSPLHSPPHALAGFTLAACIVQRASGPPPEEKAASMWLRRLVGLFSIAVLPIVVVFVLVPSYRLQRAQQAHVVGQPALQLYAAAESMDGVLHAEIDEKFGIALLDAKDYESARKHFKEALQGSDSGSVYLGLGTAEYQLGNKSDAYAALERAVYRWPSHLNAWRLLMRVCPVAERGAWLAKAARFLRGSEIKKLERETGTGTPPS